MRQPCPIAAPALVGALVFMLSGCQQIDQKLPFEVDEGAQRTASVDAGGGLVSVPPDFSIEFPAGSLTGTTSVSVAPRLTTFPASAGLVVPGTAYDVGPVGVGLAPGVPARVQIVVPQSLLGAGEDVLLAVGLLRQDGSVVTRVTSYDPSSGILTADVDSLAPVAAVVAFDAIPVGDLAGIPTLAGGSISPPATVAEPTGPAPAGLGGADFTAACSVDDRPCLSSGIVDLWVDDVVRERLGEEIVLMNTTVSADLELLTFDVNDVPTEIVGSVAIDGDLRARLSSVVAGRAIGDDLGFVTGPGPDPAVTGLSFSGSSMILAQTPDGTGVPVEYEVSGIGTGEQITIRLVGALAFANADGPPSLGQIVVDVRLRR